MNDIKLNETALGIELEESAIPIRPEVHAACGLLGLDALYCANEGKMLCVTAPEDAGRVLEAMHGTEEGRNAALIGKVTDAFPGRVGKASELMGCGLFLPSAASQAADCGRFVIPRTLDCRGCVTAASALSRVTSQPVIFPPPAVTGCSPLPSADGA